MKNKGLIDNLKFEDATEGVIFNHYSLCEIIKHIMMNYGNITYQEADKKIKEHYVSEVPKSLDDVVFLTHELEYHWAMLMLHGDMYWLKGISSDFNKFKKDYLAWETRIKEQYKLKESYEYYTVKTDKD